MKRSALAVWVFLLLGHALLPAPARAQVCQSGVCQLQPVRQAPVAAQVYAAPVAQQAAQHASQKHVAPQQVAPVYSQQIVQKRVARQQVAHAQQYAQLDVQKINQVYVPQAVYHEQQVLLPAYDHEYSFAASQAAYRSGLGGYHAQAVAPDTAEKKLNQKLDQLAGTVELLAEIVARQVAASLSTGGAGQDSGRDAGKSAVALGRELFVQKCVGCHRGKQPEGRPQFAEFDDPLLTLDVGAKQKIYDAIQAGRMPPAKDGHGNALETPLPDDEFLAIGAWLKQDGWQPKSGD